jgi:hypothetical protein
MTPHIKQVFKNVPLSVDQQFMADLKEEIYRQKE